MLDRQLACVRMGKKTPATTQKWNLKTRSITEQRQSDAAVTHGDLRSSCSSS